MICLNSVVTATSLYGPTPRLKTGRSTGSQSSEVPPRTSHLRVAAASLLCVFLDSSRFLKTARRLMKFVVNAMRLPVQSTNR
jgi:hypothetical protein